MIRVEHVTLSFPGCTALNDVSLSVRPGEMVALIGASGSGKSTLLRTISGLAAGDGGQITVMGGIVQRQGRLRRDIRKTRAHIAVIFQQFNLVNRLSVLTNAMLGALGRLPLWRTLLHRFPREVRALALDSLARVGIRDKATQRAAALSGGQQQRAAIARALVQKAKVLLADEPIASLDPESSRNVMEILADINARDGITILVSLHQVDYALRFCPRAIALKNGGIVYDGPSAALTPAFLRALYGASGQDTLAGGEIRSFPGGAAQKPLQRGSRLKTA
ncbi:MAG: phosphonate ABC transporter ATP-binding protein [Desulfovibrio sp.]|jgi:phosphonate transport system ATP-binding protein|nr:phosphonate ABC transporter ATP-binding protein [Desulfovibrio sp.]